MRAQPTPQSKYTAHLTSSNSIPLNSPPLQSLSPISLSRFSPTSPASHCLSKSLASATAAAAKSLIVAVVFLSRYFIGGVDGLRQSYADPETEFEKVPMLQLVGVALRRGDEARAVISAEITSRFKTNRRIQRNLQFRIEEQGKHLQMMFEQQRKMEKGKHRASSSNRDENCRLPTTETQPSVGKTDHQRGPASRRSRRGRGVVRERNEPPTKRAKTDEMIPAAEESVDLTI